MHVRLLAYVSGPRPTAEQYRNLLFDVCEARVALAKGQSVSGPHYKREAGVS